MQLGDSQREDWPARVLHAYGALVRVRVAALKRRCHIDAVNVSGFPAKKKSSDTDEALKIDPMANVLVSPAGCVAAQLRAGEALSRRRREIAVAVMLGVAALVACLASVGRAPAALTLATTAQALAKPAAPWHPVTVSECEHIPLRC